MNYCDTRRTRVHIGYTVRCISLGCKNIFFIFPYELGCRKFLQMLFLQVRNYFKRAKVHGNINLPCAVFNMLLLICALPLIMNTLAMRSLVNVDVPSKSFQRLMLTSRRDMFQLKNFLMLLEFAFNRMFTPAKFPLDSHNFRLSRLGGIVVVI